MSNDTQKVRGPSFDGVAYGDPESYLFLDSSFVQPAGIQALGLPLRSPNPHQTLVNISDWLRRRIQCRNVPAEYGWRTVDQILAGRRYIGCADYAMVFGALTRVCGIPTVWVKSMDVDWIEEFRRSGRFDGGSGHVFLELFIHQRWCLLDASAVELWEEYRTNERLLPGGRYAYDKGGNPHDMILSHDWDRWKRQTIGFFSAFDLTDLDRAVRAFGCRRRLSGV